MFPPIFRGYCVWSLFNYVLHVLGALPSSAIILTKKEGADCFALIAFLVSHRCLVTVKCSVALPLGALGWSALCDFGIYWSYSLTSFDVMLVIGTMQQSQIDKLPVVSLL